jgi:hypothetical protein
MKTPTDVVIRSEILKFLFVINGQFLDLIQFLVGFSLQKLT